MHSNTKLAALALSLLLVHPAAALAGPAQSANAPARTITVQKQSEAPAPVAAPNLVKFTEYPAAVGGAGLEAGTVDVVSSEFIHAQDTTLVQADARPTLATTAQKLKEAEYTPKYEDVLKSITLTDQDYKGAVDKNINMFSVNLKKNFVRYLERSGRYMGVMQSILRENYLPEDLVFLALIESGFNPKAYSWANASGPWQFISGTGKRYGLKIDKWVDERRDPIKSTRAAAAYLTDLYKMFGSWSLAMASYNAGEGNVARAVKKNGSQDYWQIRQSRYMHPETKEYVPKFMAAKMIAENPAAYGFDSIQYDEPFEFDEVEVTSAVSLDTVAKCSESTLQDIEYLNPELKRGCTPPNTSCYKLRVPKGAKEKFVANYASLPDSEKAVSAKYAAADEDNAGQSAAKSYKVRRGDTLSNIARRYGTTTTKLARLNGISSRSKLRVGQRIKVSGSSKSVAKSSSGKSSGRTSAKSHRVKSGDTLWSISKKYGVSMDALQKANSLSKRSVIKKGQRLAIPAA